MKKGCTTACFRQEGTQPEDRELKTSLRNLAGTQSEAVDEGLNFAVISFIVYSDRGWNLVKMTWITKAQYEFLKVEHTVTPTFYLLPKIHKSLVNPSVQPIVAGKNSLSQPLSKFVEL